MDRDRGGALGGEEVKQLMEMLGMKVRDDEIEALIAEVRQENKAW
jgi:calmodulin